jgi:hypothetical protein
MVRLRETHERSVFTRRRGPCLIATLLLAVTLYATDGGGAFYEEAYAHLARTEARLIRAPDAPLSFLNLHKPAIERFELRGIVYSSNRPVAVINQKPCAPGEKIAVRIGKHTEIVQCVAIDPAEVRIQTVNGETASLSLPSGALPSEEDTASVAAP